MADKYKHCPICNAVLVRKVNNDIVFCQLCGWSENKESDNKESSYIG